MQKRVVLKSGRETPFLYRHPWVFSGAIDQIDDNIENGDFVNVLDFRGNFLGQGLFNENSGIAVRLFQFFDEKSNVECILESAICHAIELRKPIYLVEHTNAFRLINGEGDFLPGLICDLYNDKLSFQFNSLGLNLRKTFISKIVAQACREILGVNIISVFDRTPDKILELEGMTAQEFLVSGKPEPCTEIIENGYRFSVNLLEGQKTGFYTDQRENRKALAKILNGKTGCDLFCYTGGFAVNLAKNNTVTAVDSSIPALETAQKNITLNGLTANVIFQDVFAFLSKLKECDFINADPPKYIVNEKDRKSGIKHYSRLYTLCMEKIKNGGYLAASSCSGLLIPEDFFALLRESAIQTGNALQLIYRGGAGQDYPLSAHCPENEYLKFFIFRVHKT